MSKLARAAHTSHTLSLAAMEEASRLGLREADLDHLLLALVISEQPAGRALRNLGIGLPAARRAVEDQHASQCASLGVETSFPAPGPIVFHETGGYRWTRRATDLISRSGGRRGEVDAAAVLRELVVEPSGLVAAVLHRLGTTPATVLESLERLRATVVRPATLAAAGRVTVTTDTFVPAPVEQVWSFLADPARVPEWETTVGTMDGLDRPAVPGAVWRGHAPEVRPDGKPVRTSPRFRGREVRLVHAQRPDRVVWRFTSPEVPRARAVDTEFLLATTTGGTQVTLTTSFGTSSGWRGLVRRPLLPLQRFLLWIAVVQTGGAVSRAFR